VRKEVPEGIPATAAQPTCLSGEIPQFDYGSVSPQVARFLKEQAVRIRKYSTKAVIQIGKDLKSAKHYLSHGAFLRWVENEVGIAARTAQDYMRVASWASDKSAAVALLPATALYALSAPGVPKEFVQEVLRMAEEGERVRVSSLRAQLKFMRTERRRADGSLREKEERPDQVAELVDGEVMPLIAHVVGIIAHATSVDEFAQVHSIMTSKRVLDCPELSKMLERAFASYEPASQSPPLTEETISADVTQMPVDVSMRASMS
jgi:hypothetical protein